MSHLEQELCEEIYDAYKERLYWYMRRKFDWLKDDDLHDILQETWFALSRNIWKVGYYESSKQFNWLTAVCRHKLFDFVKKQKWVVEEERETVEMLIDMEKVTSIEDKIIDKLMMEKLLKSLNDEERKILYLSLFAPKKKKKSNADACKFYRIKQKLRKLWKDGDGDEKE